MSLNDASLISAASFLLDDLADNGCQAVATSSVSDFQSAYNASAGGSLAVDGLYGPLTSGALQATINANSSDGSVGGKTAPAGCVSQGGGGGGGNTLPPIVVTGSTSSSKMPYVIGALVVAAAGGAYLYSRKKRRH